jgi:predicted Zn-dependent peptidase
VRSERRQRYEDVPYGPERFAVALALYPEGHPSRHLTIGLHDHIQAATVEEITDWYRTWYVPANATLVIAGDVDLAEANALVDRFFGSFPPSIRPTRPPKSATNSRRSSAFTARGSVRPRSPPTSPSSTSSRPHGAPPAPARSGAASSTRRSSHSA